MEFLELLKNATNSLTEQLGISDLSLKEVSENLSTLGSSVSNAMVADKETAVSLASQGVRALKENLNVQVETVEAIQSNVVDVVNDYVYDATHLTEDTVMTTSTPSDDWTQEEWDEWSLSYCVFSAEWDKALESLSKYFGCYFTDVPGKHLPYNTLNHTVSWRSFWDPEQSMKDHQFWSPVYNDGNYWYGNRTYMSCHTYNSAFRMQFNNDTGDWNKIAVPTAIFDYSVSFGRVPGLNVSAPIKLRIITKAAEWKKSSRTVESSGYEFPLWQVPTKITVHAELQVEPFAPYLVRCDPNFTMGRPGLIDKSGMCTYLDVMNIMESTVASYDYISSLTDMYLNAAGQVLDADRVRSLAAKYGDYASDLISTVNETIESAASLTPTSLLQMISNALSDASSATPEDYGFLIDNPTFNVNVLALAGQFITLAVSAVVGVLVLVVKNPVVYLLGVLFQAGSSIFGVVAEAWDSTDFQWNAESSNDYVNVPVGRWRGLPDYFYSVITDIIRGQTSAGTGFYRLRTSLMPTIDSIIYVPLNQLTYNSADQELADVPSSLSPEISKYVSCQSFVNSKKRLEGLTVSRLSLYFFQPGDYDTLADNTVPSGESRVYVRKMSFSYNENPSTVDIDVLPAKQAFHQSMLDALVQLCACTLLNMGYLTMERSSSGKMSFSYDAGGVFSGANRFTFRGVNSAESPWDDGSLISFPQDTNQENKSGWQSPGPAYFVMLLINILCSLKGHDVLEIIGSKDIWTDLSSDDLGEIARQFNAVDCYYSPQPSGVVYPSDITLKSVHNGEDPDLSRSERVHSCKPGVSLALGLSGLSAILYSKSYSCVPNCTDFSKGYALIAPKVKRSSVIIALAITATVAVVAFVGYKRYKANRAGRRMAKFNESAKNYETAQQNLAENPDDPKARRQWFKAQKRYNRKYKKMKKLGYSMNSGKMLYDGTSTATPSAPEAFNKLEELNKKIQFEDTYVDSNMSPTIFYLLSGHTPVEEQLQ